jgi:hypothetical protein
MSIPSVAGATGHRRAARPPARPLLIGLATSVPQVNCPRQSNIGTTERLAGYRPWCEDPGAGIQIQTDLVRPPRRLAGGRSQPRPSLTGRDFTESPGLPQTPRQATFPSKCGHPQCDARTTSSTGCGVRGPRSAARSARDRGRSQGRRSIARARCGPERGVRLVRHGADSGCRGGRRVAAWAPAGPAFAQRSPEGISRLSGGPSLDGEVAD